ncbi:MAG TPA: bifunctional UDP-N-acetylglucosamine diphosphorylase/glucosamine-1-phosphate N-acetyltransferase GlmU [Candidatus Dormibacteraeota bacterium]
MVTPIIRTPRPGVLLKEQPLAAVILAAGQGTRMRSRTPKVLHPIAGRPMIDHVLAACEAAGVKRIAAVVSPSQPDVAAKIGGRAEVAYQDTPGGSGDALRQAPPEVLAAAAVLVVNADAPLLRPETIERLVDRHRRSKAAATIAAVQDPERRDGRILRGADGAFERIVEYKDATAAQRRGGEVNVGVYVFRGGSDLLQALAMLEPANAAGEFYLTDVFKTLRPVEVVEIDDPDEGLGVNDRIQLARAEKAMRRRILEDLMRSGVTVVDPGSTFVDAGVRVGRDTVIEPFSFLRGETVVGEDCHIGPFADIRDSHLGDGCRVDRSWLDRARMAEGSDCGPFARLRPGTEIGIRVHVGSFAEIVRSKIGAGTAVPHMSYLGDATVGERVNIGAGTITANYDGERKHSTEIGDDAFVGVDTMFIAPRKMGRRSKTGAGAVVNKDIPEDSLAVGVPARALRRKTEERAS